MEVRSTKLECEEDRGLCVETDAIGLTILGEPAIIATSTTEFKITRWDQFELIAEDATPDCERDELRINRQERTVTLVSTPTYKADSCKEHLGQPQTVTYRLVDGVKIYSAREEANSKRKASLYQFSPKAKALMVPKD